MGGKGKKYSVTSPKAFDNRAFEGDSGVDSHEGKNGSLVTSQPPSPRIKNFEKYTYPNVCTYCKSIWDRKGSTELVTPCGCDGTSLLVHEICLESWLKSSGKVRCEACKTDYSIRNIKDLQAELMVQKVNFCLIAIFMPVGVVVIVGACIIMDSISRARAKAAVAGIPVEGIGIPLDRFVIYCIILGSLTLAGIIKTISMMKRKKLIALDNLTAIGNEA
eukprot:XP_003728717.1 PREDICTED: E3 ubiquitin-protein ligase MARCH8 [Strongylocentrotus purpuratus]